MSLVICAACSRHIRRDEIECPFCKAVVPAAVARAPERALPSARLGRAALLAFAAASVGTGCGGKTTRESPGAAGGGAASMGGGLGAGGAKGGTGATGAGGRSGIGGGKSIGGAPSTGGALSGEGAGGVLSAPPYG